MIHWLTTSPNPRSPATGYDAGQRGWRLHAVEAPEHASEADVRRTKAVCGVLPSHGWGLDLFIDRRCTRCVLRLGVETAQERYAREELARWRAQDLTLRKRRARIVP